MPINKAVVLPSSGAYPLQLTERPYTQPPPNSLVIATKALAINPVDWMIQTQGTALMYNWLTYPCVVGADVAGIVHEVGSAVTRFKVGGRVVAHAVGTDNSQNDPGQGAFQEYVVVLEDMAFEVPPEIELETAVVMPLGAATAVAGLWQDNMLGLRMPGVQATASEGANSKSGTAREKQREVVLITAGASSVGCNAIQLAVAAGYEVITTCSPKNFDMVKRLGATNAFDYNSPSLEQDLMHLMRDRKVAGALSTGAGAAELCVNVLGQCKNARKFVAMATYPQLKHEPKTLATVRRAMNFMSWNVRMLVTSWWMGVGWKFIFATTVLENGLGKKLYTEILPELLANGDFVPAPEPWVVGHGLEKVQEAMDLQKKGVSAKKVVVTI